QRILHNEDVSLYVSKRSEPMPYFLRDSDGDLCYFVHRGAGLLETDYGPLRYEEGDFLVLPKGTTHRLVPDGTSETFLYAIEGRGEYRLPDKGILGKHALFDPGVLETPEAEHHEDRGVLAVRDRRGLHHPPSAGLAARASGGGHRGVQDEGVRRRVRRDGGGRPAVRARRSAGGRGDRGLRHVVGPGHGPHRLAATVRSAGPNRSLFRSVPRGPASTSRVASRVSRLGPPAPPSVEGELNTSPARTSRSAEAAATVRAKRVGASPMGCRIETPALTR